ncbi:glycosyltransferase family 1 protein [Pseudanabaena biceps]|nr:glycosyltransferase family 1 protein [Pseudanabaena biceps]
MRIFLSCLQSKVKHPIPAYQFWEVYFKNGIEEAGHEWLETEEVDWAEGLVYLDEESLIKWRDRTWNIVVSAIKKKHKENPINLFLSYLFPKQVSPDAIREIQDLGIPCVNFYCDNVRDFKHIPIEFYCFDLHWVPEFKALNMYQHAGLNYVYAAMPVWIAPEYRHSNHVENYGISFIGSRDIQRERLFAESIKSGINLEIRGAGWLSNAEENIQEYQGLPQKVWQKINNQKQIINNDGLMFWLRKVSAKFVAKIPNQLFVPYVKEKPNFDEYIKITQQSQITLGVNRYPSFHYSLTCPNTYSRMRDIEAPMLGACYLTEWTEGLEDLYELGEEIETYTSVEEMIDKIHYLIANPQKRRTMRIKAQIKALEKHNILSTLEKIVRNL